MGQLDGSHLLCTSAPVVISDSVRVCTSLALGPAESPSHFQAVCVSSISLRCPVPQGCPDKRWGLLDSCQTVTGTQAWIASRLSPALGVGGGSGATCCPARHTDCRIAAHSIGTARLCT